MKQKRKSQRLVTPTPTERRVGDDVRRLKSKRVEGSLSLVTSSPTKGTSLRREFRAWRASLPTQLERDTLLTPEWVAESVVQEAERFLQAHLPDDFVERLAARAYDCYDRNQHFHKVLNRRGNGGRQTLYMFMRHWTAGWLTAALSPWVG